MGGVKRNVGSGGGWREGGWGKVCFPFHYICPQSLTQFKDDEQGNVILFFFFFFFWWWWGLCVCVCGGGGGHGVVGVIWCFVTVCLRQETVFGRAALDNGMLGVMRVGKKMKRVLCI